MKKERKYSILILLLLCNICDAQTGIYKYQNFPAYYEIEFQPNNNFVYSESWSSVQIIGKGQFEILDESLCLNFEVFDIPNNEAIYSKKSNHRNKIKLSITAIDFETQKEIDSIYVNYENRNGTHKTKLVSKGKIKIKPWQFPLTIKFYGSNHSTQVLELKDYGNYNVSIELIKGITHENYKVKTGQEKYKIIELNDRKMILYLESQKYASEFIRSK